jgi:hypothetical protein
MRCIIAGGRDFVPSYLHWERLDKLHEKINITVVISGTARGADTFGEQWAIQNHIPVEKYPAQWRKYGKSAGYRRNVDMAMVADAVILFPGGRGTWHMANIAKERGLQRFVFTNKEPVSPSL